QTTVDKMNQVFASHSAKERKNNNPDEKIHFDLQPFLDIHLDSEVDSGNNGLARASNPVYSYILSGIAIFLLIIACINFVNLAIARSMKRAKEIGIRKVNGGQRSDLILQFMTESFMFAFAAFVLALILTYLALPTFNELSNKYLSLSYLLDARLI